MPHPTQQRRSYALTRRLTKFSLVTSAATMLLTACDEETSKVVCPALKQYSVQSQADLNDAREKLRTADPGLFERIDRFIRDYKQLRDACRAAAAARVAR